MRILPISVLALAIPAIVGCKAIEAMDATDAMKKDLASMKATTAGMAVTTSDMKDTTIELKRKASLGEGLKLFGAPENNEEHTPPAVGLLAGAKLIAENMTAEELVDFTVGKLNEINSTMPRETEFDRRLEGQGGYSAKYVEQYNRSKLVKIVGLKAIAAQIPQSTLERIIQEQIREGGARSDEAFTLLEMRANFISEYFLGSNLFKSGKKIDNIGKLRKAFRYAKQLQYIADVAAEKNGENADKYVFKTSDAEGVFLKAILPAEKLPGEEGCKTDQELQTNPACKPSQDAAPAFNEKLKLTVAKPWFRKIVDKIDTEISESVRGTASREVAEIRAEAERLGSEEGSQQKK